MNTSLSFSLPANNVTLQAPLSRFVFWKSSFVDNDNILLCVFNDNMTFIVIYYLLISVVSLFAASSWPVDWDLSKRTGHNNNLRLVVVTLVSFVDNFLKPMCFSFWSILVKLVSWVVEGRHQKKNRFF